MLNSNQVTEHPMTDSILASYLLAFIGGFLGAFSYVFKHHQLHISNFILFTAPQIDWTEFCNYCIRSIGGGIIMLLFKLVYDVITGKFKKRGTGNE